MNIQKLPDGTLLIPQRVETDGAIGDGMRKIKPGSDEYAKFLKEYEREQELP